jgi:hypothetical protein
VAKALLKPKIKIPTFREWAARIALRLTMSLSNSYPLSIDPKELHGWGNEFGLKKMTTEGDYEYAKRVRTVIYQKVLFNGLERAKIIAYGHRRIQNGYSPNQEEETGSAVYEKGKEAQTQAQED